jgi:2,3-bisphosphoglycerate-independent phosphoglycerate mutase
MKTALIIMDGWGKELDKERSAIAKANTPFVDSLYKDYPNASLITFGKDVGLPEGQMGNSEVGHMNIGAGRIVYQELQRVHHAIETGELARNKALLASFAYAKEHKKALHLMGLVSDGGVHSHINHVKALCTYAQDFGLEEVYVHCFTDGRDCAPQSGLGFIQDLENFLKNKSAKIASVVGRYYAMDRDKRWERVAKAYQLLVNGIGNATKNISEAIQASYKAGVNDEFIEPIIHALMKKVRL